MRGLRVLNQFILKKIKINYNVYKIIGNDKWKDYDNEKDNDYPFKGQQILKMDKNRQFIV